MTVIKKRIYLEPKYLDQNIENHLLNKVSRLMTGECSKTHGHILSIKKLIEFINISDTIFIVTVEAETFKPEPGKKVFGTVNMIFNDGLFIDINKTQKMLIPSSNDSRLKFDKTRKSYKIGNIEIKEGDEINCLISNVKYSNGNFSCVGSLA